LLRIHFKIITDCRAFALTMNKKDLCVHVVLLLEEFDYVIEHRPEKSMLHIDALSRNPLPVCMIIDEHNSLTIKFKQAQQDNSDVKKVFNVIKKGNIDDYIIRNDLLFKRRNGEILFVVLKSMRTQIIKRMHDQSYFSVAKTEAFLLRDYFISNAKSKIEKVIRNCITCILAEKKQDKQEGR